MRAARRACFRNRRGLSVRNSGSCCWNRRGCFLSESQCVSPLQLEISLPDFFCSLGSFKNGSTTKTRPTRQTIARRSCSHAHPEKKQNRAWRQRCCLKNRSGKAQRSRSSASPCTKLPRKKNEVPQISREPASCSILNARPCPMTGSSSDASNVWTRWRSCRMTRSGLYPTRRNAHSDMGPERVAEIMIVRFGPTFLQRPRSSCWMPLDLSSIMRHKLLSTACRRRP